MVELGTGYFAEKNIPDAKDLIDRKVRCLWRKEQSYYSWR